MVEFGRAWSTRSVYCVASADQAMRTSGGTALRFLVPAGVCEHLLAVEVVVIVRACGTVLVRVAASRNESGDEEDEHCSRENQPGPRGWCTARERTQQRPKPRGAWIHCAGGNSSMSGGPVAGSILPRGQGAHSCCDSRGWRDGAAWSSQAPGAGVKMPDGQWPGSCTRHHDAKPAVVTLPSAGRPKLLAGGRPRTELPRRGFVIRLNAPFLYQQAMTSTPSRPSLVPSPCLFLAFARLPSPRTRSHDRRPA